MFGASLSRPSAHSAMIAVVASAIFYVDAFRQQMALYAPPTSRGPRVVTWGCSQDRSTAQCRPRRACYWPGGAEATNDADAPESISRPCDILDETACEARNNDPDAYQSVARAHQIPVPGSEREGRSFGLLGCVYTHASLSTG